MCKLKMKSWVKCSVDKNHCLKTLRTAQATFCSRRECWRAGRKHPRQLAPPGCLQHETVPQSRPAIETSKPFFVCCVISTEFRGVVISVIPSEKTHPSPVVPTHVCVSVLAVASFRFLGPRRARCDNVLCFISRGFFVFLNMISFLNIIIKIKHINQQTFKFFTTFENTSNLELLCVVALIV